MSTFAVDSARTFSMEDMIAPCTCLLVEHAVWLAARIAALERVCLEDYRPKILCGETWPILSDITSSKVAELNMHTVRVGRA